MSKQKKLQDLVKRIKAGDTDLYPDMYLLMGEMMTEAFKPLSTDHVLAEATDLSNPTGFVDMTLPDDTPPEHDEECAENQAKLLSNPTEPKCDCHLHEFQVCDICQGVDPDNPEPDKDVTDPKEPEVYHCDIGHSRSYKFKKDYENHMKNMHEPCDINDTGFCETHKREWYGCGKQRATDILQATSDRTKTETLAGKAELEEQIDQIVFRCIAQGQYWGTASGEGGGELDPDYKPDKPIDRTQANKLIQNLIHQAVIKELEKLLDGRFANDHRETMYAGLDANENIKEAMAQGYNYARDTFRKIVKAKIAELKEIV